MSLKSFAISKKIYEFEEFQKNRVKDYTEGGIFEHINILSDLHGRLRGCPIPLTNLINKMVENFKISEMFFSQDIERYRFNSRNEFEENVARFGEKILYRIRKILDIIHENNYENMILRSIRNKEICVYNVNINDFCVDSDSKIYVRNINNFCENILEYDYVKFFTRLKRSNRNIEFIKMCSYVCSKENFGINSYNFILACTSFPYEFVKVISRYRDLGRELSDYSRECDFGDVLIKDGESLV